jgi:hypothetical protein
MNAVLPPLSVSAAMGPVHTKTKFSMQDAADLMPAAIVGSSLDCSEKV